MSRWTPGLRARPRPGIGAAEARALAAAAPAPQSLVFAMAMTAITAGAHASGGGDLAGLAWVAPMLLLAYGVRRGLGDLACSLPVCATVCTALQLGAHELLMALASRTHGAVTVATPPCICDTELAAGTGQDMAGMAGMSHDMGGMGHDMAGLGGTGMAMGHHGTVMVVTHLTAALLAAWWLRRGEVLAASIGAWVAARALPPTPRARPLLAVPARCAPVVVVRRLRSRLLVLDAPGRAPPLAAA